MSNVIKFSEIAKRSAKSNKEVKEALSNPMKILYKQIIFQAINEMGEQILGMVSESIEDNDFYFDENDKMEIYIYLIEELKDVIEAMEYVREELGY